MAGLIISIIYASASQKIKDVTACYRTFPAVTKFSFVFGRKECKFCSLPTVLNIHQIMVVKSEPFDRKKIWAGISYRHRACRKRPILAETMNKIVGEYIMEILSRNIGEKILEKLWNIDLVAYIRFASVYRKFDDISHIYESIGKTEKRMYEKTKKIKNFYSVNYT
ncbi:hypothetical protein ATZ36_10375 [Candidatus Endomicrobiellum trichonymphae]|uniref:ATP-cone domain-containing protein n=1 Tax=Endomicrobium trichonymphae TaxID=1408204 RepID=A0A1E5IGK1_ENDTX|nr:hypothetical protein ATZ36_10375 [Candidatus Endomicrobium trichonymphae]